MVDPSRRPRRGLLCGIVRESVAHNPYSGQVLLSGDIWSPPEAYTTGSSRSGPRIATCFTCNIGQPDCLRQLGNVHNHRSIYACIAFDRSEYIPGSGSHLRSSTPATCSLPGFMYVANTSIQTVVKSYYSSTTTLEYKYYALVIASRSSTSTRSSSKPLYACDHRSETRFDPTATHTHSPVIK